MTTSEILDSDKFRLRIGERFRDQLDDMQAAIMSCYIYRTDDADLGRYVREILGPHVKHVIDQIRYESEPVEPIDPEAP
jgi:aromatic ring-cleaving dioxygenase